MTGHRLFVDTGAWFAHVNGADPDHRSVRQILDRPAAQEGFGVLPEKAQRR